MNEDLALMRKTILGGLPEARLRDLLRSGQVRLSAHPAGKLLYQEGEPCLALTIVLSGCLAVERLSPKGEVMGIASFEAGDLLGGNLLFSSDPVYRLPVTVLAPSRIAAIKKDTLMALLLGEEGFLPLYLNRAADNAGLLEGKLKQYANLGISQRVLNHLLSQGATSLHPKVALKGGKTALARQLGAHRCSLSRVLQQMRQQGILDFDRDSITLKAFPEQ